ncbi:sugar phosphate isomerase/epimerase [Cohnella sp. LGH]|uniref:sugar phosphate isomerase/epimerase family protein n=1 Tax=Cohnella sp. LGH TaxID=1619153 RepID=UPI001ADD169D|nr:sugar phosphate isomerase/epimerase family protein [Cohnella sp. LGH]QTH40920.1 sugar phosphate isomerase/epimerase [Cohnella sp. LGH]
MKLGISTYCLVDKLRGGEMTVLDVLEWAKEQRCEHVELVPYGYSLVDDGDLAERVRRKAEQLGLELSNYALPANFAHESEEDFLAEVERLKGHVDLLAAMGIRSMRHDVVAFTIPQEEADIAHFEKNLPRIAEGSRLIADYAAERGIATNIENHGWGVQHSDRVQRVIAEVNRPNFRTVLDIGNFLCVDEPPLIGVAKNLPLASIVHLKDFYYRGADQNPGDGKWFRTANGNFLRGSIFGQGDLPVRSLLKLIKGSGYDGYLTLEFEGMEESREGTAIGLDNVLRLWDEA